MTRAPKILTLLFSLGAATAALAAPATLVPNAVKYRDSSLPHATGRSGNASIEAFALLGKDGKTDVVVTANGTIEKVQLRAGDANALNFTNDSNAFAQQLDDLTPHQPLHVQANVSAVDGSRTDVVDVEEIVKSRPDLAVADVRAPEYAMPGVPFAVAATIREQNGDLGARADCVLSADGVELDRARGIWVDAHDSVTCSFSARLNDMGAHTLTVSAAAVHPGDWDETNNCASASTTIALPFDQYHASAADTTLHTITTTDGPGSHQESVTDQWEQWADLSGTRAVAMNMANFHAHVTESSDGTLITETSSDDMAIRSTSNDVEDDGSRYECFDGWDNYQSIHACLWTRPDGSPLFQFGSMRWSTEVMYLSKTWSLSTGAETDSYTHSTSGLQDAHYGSSVSLDVTITDGATTIAATPTVSLAPYFVDRGTHGFCRPAGRTGQVCTETGTTESGKRGVADATNAY
ncbi:MAG TPA: hypothetical protein VFN10_10685 [Thermoanaerobaculia bacterium]|nr:hypothetical protein [Thermoanaerobaculia bacterium]